MNEDRKKIIEEIEDSLEALLETVNAGDALDEALEKGFTLNTGEGMPTFLIRLVPKNLRDAIVV